MTVMNAIRAALEDHLVNTVGIPTIAYSNVDFDPSVHDSFVRAYFTPVSNRPANMGPDPMVRYDGLYTLTICSKSGSGEGLNLQIADILLSRFKASTDIMYGSVKIGINYSEISVGYPDSPFYCTPVIVSWYTYH